MVDKHLKATLHLAERVVRINEEKGTKLSFELDYDGIGIYDINKRCRSIISDNFLDKLYFEPQFKDDFDYTFECFNNELDKYEK